MMHAVMSSQDQSVMKYSPYTSKTLASGVIVQDYRSVEICMKGPCVLRYEITSGLYMTTGIANSTVFSHGTVHAGLADSQTAEQHCMRTLVQPRQCASMLEQNRNHGLNEDDQTESQIESPYFAISQQKKTTDCACNISIDSIGSDGNQFKTLNRQVWTNVVDNDRQRGYDKSVSDVVSSVSSSRFNSLTGNQFKTANRQVWTNAIENDRQRGYDKSGSDVATSLSSSRFNSGQHCTSSKTSELVGPNRTVVSQLTKQSRSHLHLSPLQRVSTHANSKAQTTLSTFPHGTINGGELDTRDSQMSNFMLNCKSDVYQINWHPSVGQESENSEDEYAFDVETHVGGYEKDPGQLGSFAVRTNHQRGPEMTSNLKNEDTMSQRSTYDNLTENVRYRQDLKPDRMYNSIHNDNTTDRGDAIIHQRFGHRDDGARPGSHREPNPVIREDPQPVKSHDKPKMPWDDANKYRISASQERVANEQRRHINSKRIDTDKRRVANNPQEYYREAAPSHECRITDYNAVNARKLSSVDHGWRNDTRDQVSKYDHTSKETSIVNTKSDCAESTQVSRHNALMQDDTSIEKQSHRNQRYHHRSGVGPSRAVECKDSGEKQKDINDSRGYNGQSNGANRFNAGHRQQAELRPHLAVNPMDRERNHHNPGYPPQSIVSQQGLVDQPDLRPRLVYGMQTGRAVRKRMNEFHVDQVRNHDLISNRSYRSERNFPDTIERNSNRPLDKVEHNDNRTFQKWSSRVPELNCNSKNNNFKDERDNTSGSEEEQTDTYDRNIPSDKDVIEVEWDKTTTLLEARNQTVNLTSEEKVQEFRDHSSSKMDRNGVRDVHSSITSEGAGRRFASGERRRQIPTTSKRVLREKLMELVKDMRKHVETNHYNVDTEPPRIGLKMKPEINLQAKCSSESGSDSREVKTRTGYEARCSISQFLEDLYCHKVFPQHYNPQSSVLTDKCPIRFNSDLQVKLLLFDMILFVGAVEEDCQRISADDDAGQMPVPDTINSGGMTNTDGHVCVGGGYGLTATTSTLDMLPICIVVYSLVDVIATHFDKLDDNAEIGCEETLITGVIGSGVPGLDTNVANIPLHNQPSVSRESESVKEANNNNHSPQPMHGYPSANIGLFSYGSIVDTKIQRTETNKPEFVPTEEQNNEQNQGKISESDHDEQSCADSKVEADVMPDDKLQTTNSSSPHHNRSSQCFAMLAASYKQYLSRQLRPSAFNSLMKRLHNDQQSIKAAYDFQATGRRRYDIGFLLRRSINSLYDDHCPAHSVDQMQAHPRYFYIQPRFDQLMNYVWHRRHQIPMC